MHRNIITIATGKKLYVDLAVNLVRSFFLIHPNTEIRFYVVTDKKDLFPRDVLDKVSMVSVFPGELGEGFSPKLYLDRISPEGKTLFIDSDCLLFKKIDFVFDVFNGKSVSVVGGYIDKGEWFGDVRSICEQFAIPHLPKFNGGIYYIEKGTKASEIFQTARDLENRYDEIGFKRLRGRPNDEVLMALSMELHNQIPVPEDGKIMGEFVNFRSGFSGDIFERKAVLLNTPGHKEFENSWPFTIGKPAIVHFLGDYNTQYPYTLFEKQLQLYFCKRYSKGLIKTITFFNRTLPGYMVKYGKIILRPFYRKIFGMRKVKRSDRIIGPTVEVANATTK